jgi:hypothetical protein
MNSIRNWCYVALGVVLCSSCTYAPPSAIDTSDQLSDSIDLSKVAQLGGLYISGVMNGAVSEESMNSKAVNLLLNNLREGGFSIQYSAASVDQNTPFNYEQPNNEIGEFELKLPIENNYLIRSELEGATVSNWNGAIDTLTDFSFPTLTSYKVEGHIENQNDVFIQRINGLSNNILDDLISQSPTVVVVSLGLTDLFEYAYYGASGDENPTLASIKKGDLITPNDFDQLYNSIIDRLLAETNATIITLNTFDVTISPYFSSIYFAIEDDVYRKSDVERVEEYYEAFNQLIFRHNFVDDGTLPYDERRDIINFFTDGWPSLASRARAIEDEYLPSDTLDDGTIIPKWRQLVEEERILYSVAPELIPSSDKSTIMPLTDAETLTKPELDIIRSRVAAFNSVISDKAMAETRVHLLDFERLVMQSEQEEINIDGVLHPTTFDVFSIFSADGYTLSTRGQVLLANEFVKLLNTELNTSITPFDVNQYIGVRFVQ